MTWTAFFFFIFISQSPVCSQESEIFLFYPGSDFTITEKQDLRKRVNGRYEGFIYRETRCFFNERVSDQPGTSYSGNVYVFEEMKRNTRLVARRLERSYPLDIRFLPTGGYLMDQDVPYPALRGVPSFSEDPVVPGDKWLAFGERVLFAHGDSVPTRARIYCEYRYDGIRGEGKDAYFSVYGQYAIRYRGEDPYGDSRLSQADGSHKVEIRIPLMDEGKIFMLDTVEEQYRMIDGTMITYSGIILTWFDSPMGWTRTAAKDYITEKIGTQVPDKESGYIEFTENEEGLMLTLPDVHFVPDRTEILPDERGRLDAIADILKDIPGAVFLVRGHTADVGTAESQQILSEQRAAAIIGELSKRGIAAERFIFEGKGGTVPLGDNATEEGRKKNRRVEIIILN